MFALCTILGNIPKIKLRCMSLLCMPLLCMSQAKQNTTSAKSNVEHAHLSSLEQCCQGATYYKQSILVRKKDLSPEESGILNHLLDFLEPPTKRMLQRVAKICRLHKDSRNTIINACISDRSDTLHIQVPSHHIQQRRLLEVKALWKFERVGLHRRWELCHKQRKWIS